MKKPFYKVLYFWVIVAIILGIALGVVDPDTAKAMKPLSDGFVNLIKMVIAPVIFCTVVSGIAGMENIKKMGRVGGKALLYFEVVSTFALVIGLFVANVFRPGEGADITKLDATAIAQYAKNQKGFVDFVLGIIPTTMLDSLAKGDILQVLLIAILVGLSLAHLGPQGKTVAKLIDDVSKVVFGVFGIIVKAAPIGAFGAMAFTIGQHGLAVLIPLTKLIGAFYLTSIVFVIVVLGVIAKLTGFSIFRFLVYIKEELLLILGTSSSESAMAPIMIKLEKLGCSKNIVDLVIPTGYSFNLDGTNIYITLAALFVAQATNTDLTLMQQLTIMGVAMISSKGASGVTGAGLATLYATLLIVPSVPIIGISLIVGIDRFMSECRALTNFVGNGVATIVVSSWEKELDRTKLNAELASAGKLKESRV